MYNACDKIALDGCENWSINQSEEEGLKIQ